MVRANRAEKPNEQQPEHAPVVGVFPMMPELTQPGETDPITLLVYEGQTMVRFAQALQGVPSEVARKVVDHFHARLGNGHGNGNGVSFTPYVPPTQSSSAPASTPAPTPKTFGGKKYHTKEEQLAALQRRREKRAEYQKIYRARAKAQKDAAKKLPGQKKAPAAKKSATK